MEVRAGWQCDPHLLGLGVGQSWTQVGLGQGYAFGALVEDLIPPLSSPHVSVFTEAACP